MSILIDALYINSGGGKVLLDILIEEFEKTEEKVCYLLDERITGKVQNVKASNSIIFMKASIVNRYKFYFQRGVDFKSVLCFGNLPPNIKLSAKTFTYFHQVIFLDIPNDISFFQKLKYKLKIFIVSLIKDNTNYWFVQSDLVKKKLADRFNIRTEEILVAPYYKPLSIHLTNSNNRKLRFLYVSNASIYKNHIRLIDAFCDFYDENKIGELMVTVSSDFPEVLNYIEKKLKLNYPINNIGFVSREELDKIYLETEFLIFPSLAESFGLGLVEAIDAGCKVLGADLPYMHAVCIPSLLFDPLDTNSIKGALKDAVTENLKPSFKKIDNNIYKIIDYLK